MVAFLLWDLMKLVLETYPQQFVNVKILRGGGGVRLSVGYDSFSVFRNKIFIPINL